MAVRVYVYVCESVCVCTSTCARKSEENIGALTLSLYHVDPAYQTQVLRVGGNLYSLDHHTSIFTKYDQDWLLKYIIFLYVLVSSHLLHF